LLALRRACQGNDALGWSFCMEKLYIYNQFFVDWLEMHSFAQGGVYL
jgi:hypothetical protein